MTWWTATNVAINNGQSIVNVTTGDDVQIAQEAGGLIIGNNPPVEIKRTFLDGSGNKKIELRLPWPYSNVTSQSAVAFPTDADLAEATRVLRAVGSDAVTFAEALAQVIGSTANTITVSTETSGDLSVVPYGKLTQQVQDLLNVIGDFGTPLLSSTSQNDARNKLGLAPRITAQPTLDLDFTKGDFKVYEQYGLTKKTISQALTTTRTSIGTYNSPFGIATAAVNEPRIEYNPVTGECLGLLAEEQRTNLLLWSEQFNNAAWNSSTGARTVTDNSIVAPDGLFTADTITADGTSAPHFVSQSLTLTAVPYAYSVFAKAGTNNFLQLRCFAGFGGAWANFNLATGAVGTVGVVSGAVPTASIQAYPNGWYRCTLVFTPTATTSSVAAYIVDSASASGGAINSLSTTIYMWGAQLEAGSFPTSYIKTEGSQVTRSTDVSITRPWTPLSEYTLFFDFDNRFNDTTVIGGVGDTFNDTVYLAGVGWSIRNNNVGGPSLGSGIGLGRNKVALRVKAGDYKSFRNGVIVQSSTNTLSVSLLPTRYKLLGSPWETTTSIANVATGTFMRQAMIFPRALSDQELIDLTRL